MSDFMERLIEKYDLLCNKYQEIEEESGEKEIHDKRVALRRIFSILSLYKISPSKVKNGKEAFKLFGELRDIQVQILKLENDYEKDEVFEYIDYLKELEINNKEKIGKFCHDKHIIFPKIKVKEMKIADIKAEVEKRLKSVVEKTKQMKKKNARSIHKVRIEFKKFRYMLENLAEIDQAYEAKLKTMKRYQDLLGDIQDSEVLLKGLTSFYVKNKSDQKKIIEVIEKKKQLYIEIFFEEKIQFINLCQAWCHVS